MPVSVATRHGRLVCLVAGLLALALTGVGCGSPPTSNSGPPTAASVSKALKNSTMKNGHFTVQGTFANGANRYTATGDGTIQMKPSYALQLNLQVPTGTFLGTIGVDEIVVNGTQYTRTGTGGWTYQPDTSNGSALSPDKYVGEETLNGTKVWHVQSQNGNSTYDLWVQESNGYLKKLAIATTDGTTFTMSLDSYNTATKIVAPEGATAATATPASS